MFLTAALGPAVLCPVTTRAYFLNACMCTCVPPAPPGPPGLSGWPGTHLCSTFLLPSQNQGLLSLHFYMKGQKGPAISVQQTVQWSELQSRSSIQTVPCWLPAHPQASAGWGSAQTHRHPSAGSSGNCCKLDQLQLTRGTRWMRSENIAGYEA